jgi:hypothetical protein
MIRISLAVITFALLLLAIPSASLFAQSQSGQFNMEERLKTEQISLNLLVQSLGRFSFRDDGFIGGRRFQLGATRIGLSGTLDNRYIYKLQTELTNSPAILDAQMGYIFSDEFRIVAGQFKPFTSFELDPDPGTTDFIDRARLVGAMMNNREIGVTALGESGNLNYRFGMYNGYGRLTGNPGGKFLYTLRLGYTSDSDDGTWNFGFNGALNTTENEPVGNIGQVSDGDRLLYGVFADYDSDSFFGTAEVLQSKFDLPGSGLEQTITGMYVTVGNKVTELDELLIRWDHLGLDLNDNYSNRVILGWNHYPAEYIQIQLNMIGQFQEGDDQFGMAANFQFRF